jgi:O-antigen/teichoic acid export membrane protein
VLQVLLARWMGASEYGVFTYAYNWTTLLMEVAGFGLTSAAVRFVPEYIAHAEWGLLRGFTSRSSQIVFLGGGALAITGSLIVWFGIPAGARLPLWLGLAAVPLFGLATHLGQIARGMKAILLAFAPMRVVQPLLCMVIVFIVVRFIGHVSSTIALVATIISALGVIAIEATGLSWVIPKETLLHASTSDRRLWLSVALPMMMGAVAYAAITQIDVAIVGLLRPSRDVGMYSAAVAISTLVSFLLVAVNAIVAPMISELFSLKEYGRLGQLTRLATLWMFFPALLVTTAIVFFGRTALGLFGPEFIAGYVPLLVLAVGQLVNALTGPVGYLTELTGHQKYAAMVYVICALLSVVLNFLFVPVWGILGAALATSIAFSIANICLYVFVNRVVMVNHKESR